MEGGKDEEEWMLLNEGKKCKSGDGERRIEDEGEKKDKKIKVAKRDCDCQIQTYQSISLCFVCVKQCFIIAGAGQDSTTFHETI